MAFELGVPVEALADYRPRYNIAPTDLHWIVRIKYEDRELLPARWGLVNSWAKDAKRAAAQINARAETLETRPAFKEAFAKRRCVVPADGIVRDRGFGFIQADGATEEVFFHKSAVDQPTFDELNEGQQVEFDSEQAPGSRIAAGLPTCGWQAEANPRTLPAKTQ